MEQFRFPTDFIYFEKTLYFIKVEAVASLEFQREGCESKTISDLIGKQMCVIFPILIKGFSHL